MPSSDDAALASAPFHEAIKVQKLDSHSYRVNLVNAFSISSGEETPFLFIALSFALNPRPPILPSDPSPAIDFEVHICFIPLNHHSGYFSDI